MIDSKVKRKAASAASAVFSIALLLGLVFSSCSLAGLLGNTSGGGNGGGSGSGGGSSTAPATPSGLAVSGATSSSLTISWSAAGGATSYQLYQDTSATGSFATEVYNSTGTSTVDTGLSGGTTYYFKVRATDSAGSSPLSAAVSAATAAASGTVVTVSNITSATVWTAGNIYVVPSITVSAPLTIDPGAIVKFEANGASMTVQSGGSISAVGTAADPIYFTSLNDSTVGGSTAGSTSTSGQVGDWDEILLNNSGSDFQYCVFSYSGYATDPALSIGAGISNTTIENSTFHNNAIGIDASSAGTGTTITNNRFYSNTGGGSVNFPLYIDTNVNLDDTNSFTDATNTLTNSYQGIGVTTNGGAASWTWGATKAPYIVSGITLSLPLKINPGVIVKVKANGSAITVASGGSIDAAGTSTSPITFTSTRDSTVGGISSTSSAAAVGDWDTIALNNAGSVFEYCNFSYSGYASDPAILIGSNVGSTTVDHSTFFDNQMGIDASNAGLNTTITNSRFYSNAGGGVVSYPLYIDTNVSLDNSNSFTDSTGKLTNTYQGIAVAMNGGAASWTWGATQAPYIVTGSTTLSDALTIDPGVIVKFTANGASITVAAGGSISAVGTAANPITFTSANDQSIGGNSSASAGPAIGDWDDIALNNSGSVFQYCNFSYSGYASDAAIVIGASSVTASITDCTFTNNVHGIDNTAGSSSTISGNTYNSSGTSGGGYNP